MHQKTRLFTVVTLLVLIHQVKAADLETGLRDCAVIPSDGERLECYDGLLESIETSIGSVSVKQTVPVKEAVAVSDAVTEKDAVVERESKTVPKITDDVGLARTPEELKETYAVVVTRCEASADRMRLSFYLDNGQVWQQANARWLSPKNCNANGVISKDFWGYKLRIESRKRAIRVSRIR